MREDQMQRLIHRCSRLRKAHGLPHLRQDLILARHQRAQAGTHFEQPSARRLPAQHADLVLLAKMKKRPIQISRFLRPVCIAGEIHLAAVAGGKDHPGSDIQPAQQIQHFQLCGIGERNAAQQRKVRILHTDPDHDNIHIPTTFLIYYSGSLPLCPSFLKKRRPGTAMIS